MKLKKVYFNAFKSLLNKELEINNSCIGFVGTNESGKSNVLSAINVLSGNRVLTVKDTPKMARESNPSIVFQFDLSEKEKGELISLISEWIKKNTLVPEAGINLSDIEVFYNVSFDKAKGQENRFFTLSGIKVDDSYLILLASKSNTHSKLEHNDIVVPVKNAIVIHEDILLDFYNNNAQLELKINELNEIIVKDEALLNSALQKISSVKSNAPLEENVANQASQIELLTEECNEINMKLDSYKAERKLLIEKLNKTGIRTLIDENNSILKKLTIDIQNNESEQKLLEVKIKDLKALTTIDDVQKVELDSYMKLQVTLQTQLPKLKLDKEQVTKNLEDLNEPLGLKYTSDKNELEKYFQPLTSSILSSFLPKVVFWENSEKYILQSQTLFSDLLSKQTLNDISRPLVNIFRIGFDVTNMDELKLKIKEIQEDPNERSKSEQKLIKKVNHFIKTVWSDYDQEMKITLERDQIRIEIFDPNHDGASFYNMLERSQGCQTFLSFLMTIGAEAEKDVIKNTILILDEPETHLHPSGVKFMLKELIKISENDNQVLYATHSIFLIDRSNFSRHVILEKEKEQTNIKPSIKGRIGYFMQEEVLYNTLDLNLNRDFSSTNKYNFVFEGDGDAKLFEYYYDKVLANAAQPFAFESTSFYQGGKCTDIQKYLKNRPIQLGTKWVFILDKDRPAEDLRKFIRGIYKPYIDKDIYVYQYEKEGTSEVQLEDMLPDELILTVMLQTADEVGTKIEKAELEELMQDSRYSLYFEKVVKNIPTDKKDLFKERFKGLLNSKIANALEEVSAQNIFENQFPVYYNWASGVTTMISQTLNPIA